MGLHVFTTTGQNKSACHGCSKPLAGKGQEFYLRASHNGCGKNFCSSCLRKLADDVDALNANKQQTQS